MSRKTLIAALVLLSATPLAGCASRNAMAVLPEDVKLAVAADAARQSLQSDTTPVSETGGPQRTPPALSPVEIEFRNRQAAVLPEELPDADSTQTAADPAAVFRRAREMATIRAMPDEAAFDDPGYATGGDDNAAPANADPNATWQAALAMHRASASDTAPSVAPYAPDTELVTAALPEQKNIKDFAEFAVSPQGDLLSQAVRTEIRLKHIGGRVARRIVVGHIEGESFAVLKRAQDIGRAVAGATGGDPGMSYDPTVAAGTVRVEYEPSTRAGG